MSYTPWPREGCTLGEARERTADRDLWREWKGRIEDYKGLGPSPSYIDGHVMDDVREDDRMRKHRRVTIDECEGRINAEFRQQLQSRKLVAHGRPWTLEAAPQLIASDLWPALIDLGFGNSAVGEGRRGGLVYLAIRVFPALLAPSRADLLAGCTLSEAFKKFVIADPEVSALGKCALKVAPRFERVFVQGHCHVDGTDEWPMTFVGSDVIGVAHPDPEKRSPIGYFRDPDPESVVDAAETLTSRYGNFLEAMRQGDVEAEGLPVATGHSARILRSIWSHNDFYFNSQSGDIFEVNHACENPPADWLTRRWVAVMLQRSAQPRNSTGVLVGEPSLIVTGKSISKPLSAMFTPDDVVAVGSLYEALEHFVFSHPEIQRLRPDAITSAKAERCLFEETAGLVGPVIGLDEPVIPMRHVSHQSRRNKEKEEFEARTSNLGPNEFDRPWPPALEAYYGAINRRAGLLFQFLQERQLVGWGDASDGHLVPLAHTIWSHEDFYVHRYNGDVYESGPRILKKKWTGVTLALPVLSPVGLFHVKPTASDPVLPVATEHARSTKPDLANDRVRSTIAARKACATWLEQIMRQNPDCRTETRQSLWEKAQKRWPASLSERSFLAARAEAIHNTGATAWGAAGASKKSMRDNRRTR